MKQGDFYSFLGKEVCESLKKELPFRLESFDKSLFPLIFPLIKKKSIIYYDSSSLEVRDSLLLFIENCGALFDIGFVGEERALHGFRGSVQEDRDVFYSALKNSFKNYSCVFFPLSLASEPLFLKEKKDTEFVVSKGTLYSDLVDCLGSLGYVSRDFVEERGDFAFRGMVVDFFPFGFRFGVRGLFEGNVLVQLFKFDIKTQLAGGKLEKFYLSKTKTLKESVGIDFFVSKEKFSRIYMTDGGISFYSLCPKKVLTVSLSSLSLSFCIQKKGLEYFEALTMAGFSVNGNCFGPSWIKGRPPSLSLSNDVYTDFSSLERGDFIVHEDFGVGKYIGLSSSNGVEGMVLSYRGTKINIFPPYFNRVSFYKKKGSLVQEDIIGKGGSWARRVSSVQKRALLVAKDLVLSFINRKGALSVSCYLDDQLERGFLKGFAFQDTRDQGLVWKEIKQDLISTSPMDRLVCGDVGFGKTELAMRASFVAAINGLSVVVLAPTTILAKQLFLSFKKRLSSSGVSVGLVSRFVSKKKQEVFVDSFLKGSLNVLVGTHKIVFNPAVLKKASLVIVDDEHKFGVKQKEAAKKLNSSVNMLYMSATPIPRTLKMALSKITNISTLSTPPSLKIETKTYVDYFSEKIIKRAVFNEVSRGGQVFFIHNKVQTMPSVVRFLEKLFPELQISFLHGQEEPSLVEKKMDLFLDKKIDVLVASSIVESGVDIPSVNTIIINNSHLLGVSQLYQMRGRVGRSSLPSFAYLLIPKKEVLSSLSRGRLKIIEKNSSLGSCYAVSLEDLNLRGGGSVFGYKQSGSSGRVGFELYNKFLEQAVNKITKKHVVLCSVSCSIPSHIPEKYLPSARLRIWLYKDLSSIGSFSRLDVFIKKTENLFGPIPLFLNNLILLKRIEIIGRDCFISKISIKPQSVEFFLDSFFWKKKIESLISALIGYNFVLVNGGGVVRVDLSFDKIFSLLNKIYIGIKNE